MNPRIKPPLQISWLLLFLSAVTLPAAVPGLIDTINPLPGAGCPRPWRVAANTVTHRIYALSEGGNIQGQGALSVVDADTDRVVGGIATQWEINGMAVNESTNRIYLSTSSGSDENHLTPAAVVIDGANNQVIGTYPTRLGTRFAVDPVTGRLFTLTFSTVDVYDGTSLALLASMPLQNQGNNLAVNPTNRTLYVTDNFNASGNALIGVYNVDSLTAQTAISTTGWLDGLEVDGSANKVYAIGLLNGGSGSPGVVVIDGTNNGTSAITLPSEDYGFVDPNEAGHSAIDPSRHRLYLGTNNFAGGPGTLVINTQTNAVAGTLAPGASQMTALPATGKLYVCQRGGGVLQQQNSIGAVDPATGTVNPIVLAYEPFAFAVNRQTGRIYVADEQAAEVLVLNGSDHSIVARITIGSVNARHNIAVSESLNRVYVARSTYDQASSVSQVVDVIDGATNQVLGTVTLPISDQLAPSQIAVDDATHHTYVAASGNVCILNATANDNSVITTLSGILTGGGIAVNSATQRVYVSGGNGFGGNNVTIINTTTNQVVKTVSAGAIPGPIAINTQTKKVYVANTGAGSVDNSVTVINGVTDSVEDTVFNINTNNSHAVSGVAVDESSNALYVCDNANQFAANGTINFFDANNNYAFLGQTSVGSYPVGAIVNPANAQLFVANDQSGTISVLGSFSLGPTPAPPAHGGLSATVFAVNESKAPTANVADTVLRFLAQQSGAPAGLSVRVQATTTPNDESSWSDLANDRGGLMTLDVARNQFVLNSSDYPLQNGVSFRAVSSASSYSDSISNVVGPFNLANSKPHLPPTTLLVLGGSMAADLYYHAKVESVLNGVALRIQVTTTPADESSWSDLNDSNAGHLTQSTVPNEFLLLVNNYPPANGLYFRALASLSGNVDSISQPVGAFNLLSDIPPKVTMTPPSPALAGGGNGSSPDNPILLQTGFFSFGASVQSGQPLKYLALGIDGTILKSFENGETSGSVVTANVIGDHVLEAFVVDKLGGRQRTDVGVLYVRIVPGSSSFRSTGVTGNAPEVAAAAGRTFHVVTNNGVWTDPTTWKDDNGQNGVPGPDDFAIIGSSTVRFGLDGDAKSVSLNGGHLVTDGATLNIYGQVTIHAATIDGPLTLLIKSGAVCELLNQTDVVFNPNASGFRGNIIVQGTCNLHGSGGIVGTDQFVNLGTVNWQKPLAPPLNAGTDPLALVRMIAANSPQNSGLISGNVSLLLTQDGAGIVSHDGGTVVSNDGGSLVSHDGGSLIGQDGAGLVSHDGGSLLSERGNGLIGQDGAGIVSEHGGGVAPQASAKTAAEGATASTGFTQTAGEIDLSHVMILGPATINGGTVTGSGVIAGDVTNNGFISPGHSVGGISILGNYTQGAQGTLVIENGGAAPNQYDHLQVSGVASLGGKLDIRDINGYSPSTLDTFSPLGFKSATGSFSSVSSNAQVTVTANGLLTSVNPNVPGPKPGQPLNISTRMNVLSGDNVLIGGFIVTGPNGSTKKVLIRGIGPSLSNFGISGTLSDPLLELHKPDGGVVTNDNWQQGDTSQIPNGFAPSDPRESVIVATLAPGNYSAVLKGAHGETGVGLAEVYDLDSTSAAQLANISTRGFVNTGDNVMIGGFIVGGTEPAKVLVRAIGPSLAAFGVQGALPATTLELHDANGSVISNEGWRNTQEADITATTIPPSNDNEAAILATLVPGNYTAIVRGKNNTTGIGLVEAYNLQ
jgi:DNA-binding beta-propeller fold protein YncE